MAMFFITWAHFGQHSRKKIFCLCWCSWNFGNNFWIAFCPEEVHLFSNFESDVSGICEHNTLTAAFPFPRNISMPLVCEVTLLLHGKTFFCGILRLPPIVSYGHKLTATPPDRLTLGTSKESWFWLGTFDSEWMQDDSRMEPHLGCLGKAEGMPPCLSCIGSVKATLGVVEVQWELLRILKQRLKTSVLWYLLY